MIRHGWLIGLGVFLALLVCGCGKPSTTGWSSFPVAIYAATTIESTPAVRQDFEDAMSFWEGRAGRKLFDYKGIWSADKLPYTGTIESPVDLLGNVIFFQNPWPFAANIAGQTTVISTRNGISASMIVMNAETPFCTGDCPGSLGRVSERRAFAHELGHFLGLQHVQDLTNVMNPIIQPGGVLTELKIDEAALQALMPLP